MSRVYLFLSENRKINEKRAIGRYKEVIKEEELILNEREPHQYRAYLQIRVFLRSVQLLERKFAQQFTKYQWRD